MKDLLEYIVKNLVSKPDAVSIDEQSEGGNANLNLSIDPSDMGLIIGKGGQTIHAIRKILTIRAIAENVRVNLQLSEPETPAETQADTSGVGEEVIDMENTPEVSEEEKGS